MLMCVTCVCVNCCFNLKDKFRCSFQDDSLESLFCRVALLDCCLISSYYDCFPQAHFYNYFLLSSLIAAAGAALQQMHNWAPICFYRTTATTNQFALASKQNFYAQAVSHRLLLLLLLCKLIERMPNAITSRKKKKKKKKVVEEEEEMGAIAWAPFLVLWSFITSLNAPYTTMVFPPFQPN